MRCSSESGQSTVEAALLLPMLFLLLGVFVQPTLLLYSQCVMNEAATEGCRLVATSTNSDASTRAYIERRLEAIPTIDAFHVGESWEIDWSGADSGAAYVSIVNHAQPLPLFGIVAGLAGKLGADGHIEQRAEARGSAVASWVLDQGYAPGSWIGAWR